MRPTAIHWVYKIGRRGRPNSRERHSIFEQPGKLRVGVFEWQWGNTANYREVLTLAAANPALNINDIATATQRIRSKYGFYVNLEQQIVRRRRAIRPRELERRPEPDSRHSPTLTAASPAACRSRAAAGDGRTTRSASAAPSTACRAGHRDFLAAGGIGLLIGDGRLNYSNERILEAYYAYSVIKGVTMTADYQLVVNPGLQRRSRAGLDLLGPLARGILAPKGPAQGRAS